MSEWYNKREGKEAEAPFFWKILDGNPAYLPDDSKIFDDLSLEFGKVGEEVMALSLSNFTYCSFSKCIFKLMINL